MTPSGTRIVVGDDGSDQAHEALRWAAARAGETAATLRIVHVALVPVMAGLGWKVDAAMEAGRLLRAEESAGRALLRRRCLEVGTLHPALHLDAVVLRGDPRVVLLRESESADLLVVGAPGRGPVPALLLGSVSSSVLRHAACPTVVVQAADENARGVLVVVRPGDDATAVRFAAEYAAAHGGPLLVLRPAPRLRWLDDELADIAGLRPELVIAVEEWRGDGPGPSGLTAKCPALAVVERPHHHRLHDPGAMLVDHGRCPVAIVPRRP